jgi:hypothetical protein
MSLLNDASLVLIPSGYKEDKVYSIIPSDGSGDLDFVRGSDGTRINSLGQVENVCWNLFNDSEDFTFGTWSKVNATVTGNTTVAPNGTTTADTIVISAGGYLYVQVNYTATAGETISMSVYSKSSTAGFLVYGGATIAGTDVEVIENVGNGWYRHIITRTFTTSGTGLVQFVGGYFSPGTFQIWGAQLNKGAIKPYFKTTDRLNVPRLTYENGCPSLLLEKQSSNLFYPSIPATTFGNGTLTSNAIISPDGTQNAFSFVPSGYGFIYLDPVVYTTAQSYTYSVYLKGTVNGQKVKLSSDLNGDLIDLTLTTNWARYSVTFTAAVGSQNFYIKSGSYLTPAENNLFYGWGAQLEASAYATSYIPTTSTSVTRLADSCYKTGISSLIGQTSGAMFVDFNRTKNYNVAVLLAIIASDDGNRIQFALENDYIYLYSLESYIAIGISSNITIPLGRNKIAVSYGANYFNLYVNGVQQYTNTNSNVPPLNLFRLGSYFSDVAYMSDSINQALLFKRGLTNTELEELTTI